MKITTTELEKLFILGLKHYDVEVKRCKVLIKDDIYLYVLGTYHRMSVMADIKLTYDLQDRKTKLLLDGEFHYGFFNLNIMKILQQYVDIPYIKISQDDIIILHPWIDKIQITPNEIEISLV